MRNWTELLPEILYLISDHMSSLKDLAVLGGVCVTWRHVAVNHNLGLPLLPLPWLMLAENQYDDLRDFYSLTDRKIYSFKLPELKSKMCMETKGWIVTLSDDGEMALVQPLTRVQIQLPNLKTSCCYGNTDPLFAVQRAVLSSPPDPQNKRDWVLVILHGSFGDVGFSRYGDKVWTVVERFGCGCMSLEYYRGKFYVANNLGEVQEYDIIGKSNGSNPVSQKKIEVVFRKYLRANQSYLVQSGGSLLVIIRDGTDPFDDCCSTEFWVFEIDVEKERFKKVKRLGTKTIFLGHSATLSVDTSLYPELLPNSIYFTDDCYLKYSSRPEDGGVNMGVYNLKDKSVRTHFHGKSWSNVCPPVWTFLTTK